MNATLWPVCLQRLEQGSGLADNHVYYRDGSLFRIAIRHGKRNTLAVLIGLEDNELPGFGLSGDKGRLDLIEDHVAFGHLFPIHDGEHVSPPEIPLDLGILPPQTGTEPYNGCVCVRV